MPEGDVAIARVVVEGCPLSKRGGDNFRRARRMLLRAFADNRWQSKASFAVTPGGFVQAPFPDDWEGKRGWSSRPKDFSALLGRAREAVDEVLTAELLVAARGRAQFLTLGVDLSDRSGKRKMDRQAKASAPPAGRGPMSATTGRSAVRTRRRRCSATRGTGPAIIRSNT